MGTARAALPVLAIAPAAVLPSGRGTPAHAGAGASAADHGGDACDDDQ